MGAIVAQAMTSSSNGGQWMPPGRLLVNTARGIIRHKYRGPLAAMELASDQSGRENHVATWTGGVVRGGVQEVLGVAAKRKLKRL